MGSVGNIFGGKSKTPPAPDYVGAAQAQGASNVEAARATAKLSNPNVINPYGTQTVTYNGDVPTLTQTLSPDQQALHEKEMAMRRSLGDVGISGAGALSDVIGKNLDLSGAPDMPGAAADTRNKVIDAMMSRVGTNLDRKRETTKSNLIAAGIPPGSEAYAREMEAIDRQQTDALQQAQIAAGAEAQRDFGQDMDRRRQAIAESITGRQTPLNEINALMSGSQVNNPFAGGLGYQAGANMQPAPIFGAAQAQGQAANQAYGANVGSQNAMMQGLFGLGQTGLQWYLNK